MSSDGGLVRPGRSPGRVPIAQATPARTTPPGTATRTVITVFGVLAGLAGIEHGVGEMLQGPVAPPAPIFQSWPDHEAFAVLNGEPALSLLPTLLISGAVTVAVGAALTALAVSGVGRRHGAVVLIGLSLLLLVVGGGFGPPLLGLILGLGATRLTVPQHQPGVAARRAGAVWPWALGTGVIGYLGLVPGTLILSAVWGTPSQELVYGLIVLAFGGVITSLLAARTHDRIQAWRQVGTTDIGTRKSE